MTETSGRLLQLLSLLQARRHWNGVELADRLEVSGRTIRRDVERLRDLGYPVDSLPGPPAATRCGPERRCLRCCWTTRRRSRSRSASGPPPARRWPGSRRPPCARWSSSSRSCRGRLRRRVRAIGSATFTVPLGPTVDPHELMLIASACRDCERLRFAYRRRDGAESRRDVEPHALVNLGQRWYLLAWDRGREDWRSFRVDRLARPASTGRAVRGAHDPRRRCRGVHQQQHRGTAEPVRGAGHAARGCGRDRAPASRLAGARSARSTPTAASTEPATTTSAGWRSGSRCSGSTSRCTSRLS